MRLAHPTNIDAKMKLAEIYEIIGEPRKALDLVYAGNPISLFPFLSSKIIIVINSREKHGKSKAVNQTEGSINPSNTSLFSEEDKACRSREVD